MAVFVGLVIRDPSERFQVYHGTDACRTLYVSAAILYSIRIHSEKDSKCVGDVVCRSHVEIKFLGWQC